MKDLKSVLEGILGDIDVTIDDSDKIVKKIAALNIKTLDFTEFVKAFADYFGCDMPKIKKGKGKLVMTKTYRYSGLGNTFSYGTYGGPDNVADIHISRSSESGMTRNLYSIRFVDDKYSKGFYVQMKLTYIYTGHGKDSRTTVKSIYAYYDGDHKIKDFISRSFLSETGYFDMIFDKNDFR